jgi:hypothetical protein
MRTLEECKTQFGEVWEFEIRGTKFVCRWPDPDVYDDAVAGQLVLQRGENGKPFAAALESLAKASCCSHTPEELDALRKSGPRMYQLFAKLGADVLQRCSKETEEQGKDGTSATPTG